MEKEFNFFIDLKMLWLRFLLLFNVSCAIVMAQKKIAIQSFSAKDGLPDRYIYEATQDTNGVMWFATASGLYCYDNIKFKKYSSKIDTPGNAISNLLHGAYYDSLSHHIYLGSLNSWQLFDPYKREFKRPKIKDSSYKRICSYTPRGFFRDKNGTMWIMTMQKGVYKINKTNDDIIDVLPLDEAVSKIFATDEGKIFATGGMGLYDLTSKPKQIRSHIPTRLANYFNDAIYDSKRQCIWLSTSSYGLGCYDLKAKKFSYYSFPEWVNGKKIHDGMMMGTGFYNEDTIWLNESMLFDLNSKKAIKIQHDLFFERMRGNKTSDVFKDREGNHWICSHDGLGMLSWQNVFCELHKFLLPEKQYYFEYSYNIVKKNGDIYFAAWNNGLQLYNQNTRTAKNLPIPLDKVNAIVQQRENIYILFDQTGIYSLDTRVNKYELISKFTEPTFVPSAVLSNDGNIYYSILDKGVFKLTPQKEIISVSNIKDKKIKLLTVDKKGEILGCTQDHIISIGKDYHVQKIIAVDRAFDEVTHMLTDKENNIWYTTLQTGLIKINRQKSPNQTLQFNKHTTQQMDAEGASGLCIDNKNRVWTGMVDGVFGVDAATDKVIYKLNRANGLLEDGSSRNLQIVGDQLVINRWSGVDVVDLKTLSLNNYKPKLIFHEIKFGDNIPSTITLPKYELSHDKAFIHLELGSSGYNNGSQNLIFYQLEGIDNDKKELNQDGIIQYNALAPGVYTLKISVQNNNGLIGEELAIAIKVLPPFYKRWWFLLLALGSFFGLVYFYHQTKLKEARIESEYKRQLSETEMKALRAQMNPHFVFNCLNSINKFILQKDTMMASQYLTKFSRLIRLILDESNEKMVDLQHEIELIHLYLQMEQMRFNKKFRYSINVDSSLQPTRLLLPSMLIQPYIENAIWHGLLHLPEEKQEDAHIEIDISASLPNHLKIVIKDNGIGRAKAQELKSKTVLKRKSYGIQLSEKRLQLLNNINEFDTLVTTEDLFTDGQASGTCVTLIIPKILD